MKKKRIAFIVYFITLLVSSIAIEVYIYTKKEKLHSEMLKQIREAFPMDETGRKNYVEALGFECIEDIKYEEVPIPPASSNATKEEKEQWHNRFGGIKHLYKLSQGGWDMQGFLLGHVPSKYENLLYNRNEDVLNEYCYFPYMIGVAEGAAFNINIAQNLIRKSLDVVYCSSKQYEKFKNKINKSNEYFYIGVKYLTKDSLPCPLGIYNPSIGSNPIFDANNNFTGYYWYGVHNFFPYRVLHVYCNNSFMAAMEKDGFEASLKDRVIYYTLSFIFITLTLVIFLKKR